MGLDNFMSPREEATLILAAVAVLLILLSRALRRSFGRILCQLLLSKVTLLFAPFVVVVLLATWGAASIGLWHRDLTGAEVIWFFSTGFIWFMRLGDAGKQPDFFKRRLKETVGIAAFMEFFMNLATLSVIGEVVLQVGLLVLGGLIAVADLQEEHKPLRRPLRSLLGMILLGLAMYTVIWLTNNWSALNEHVLLDQLLMPVWLSACVAVCFYPIVLLMGYELLFLHMKWANKNAAPRFRARLGVMLELRGSWIKIDQLTGSMPHEQRAQRRFAKPVAARQYNSSASRSEPLLRSQPTSDYSAVGPNGGAASTTAADLPVALSVGKPRHSAATESVH